MNIEVLEVSDNIVIDASATTETDALEIDRFKNFSVTFTKTGTDGNPLIELQGSNDGVNYTNPYTEDDDVTPFIGELDDAVNSVRDQGWWLFKYFRIKTVPNGTTTGSISMVLSFELA